MTTGKLITAIVLFAAAAALLVLAAFHFAGKGFLFNNAYIYASKEERRTMDKKPWYVQSAVVFCLLSAVFIVLGLSVVLRAYRIELLALPIAAAAIVYAVWSTVRIEKKRKEKNEKR